MTRPRLAVTLGDPAGVGPEVTQKALADASVRDACEVVRFGSEDPNAAPETARRALDEALDAVLAGDLDGIVTAPASKGALGGHGHTEVLRERSDTDDALMMFVGSRLRVVTATEHLSLRQVPERIAELDLPGRIRRAHQVLRGQLGVANPKIAVCGLNPHAGEGGLYGDEDARYVTPAIEAARDGGVNVHGPFAADGLFGVAANPEIAHWDCIVALYHDQALAPFKAVHFLDGVHVTAGLPFPRTSPVHGTCMDIAGKGVAHPGSMIAALKLCAEMALRMRESR